MNMDPWLSPQTGIGTIGMSNSDSKVFNQLACLAQSDKAMYSASVEDSATVFCACDRHLKIPLANWKKLPVTDQRLIVSAAQSESMNAIIPFPGFPSYTKEYF